MEVSFSRIGRVAAVAVAVIAFSSSSAAAEEWRIATLAPDGSAWMKILSRGAAEIASATDRRVTYKYYTGGVQGDEKDTVHKVQIGQLDGASLTSVGLSLIDQSIRVLELPRMFESAEELDYVRAKMWPTFRKRFARKGYHLGEPGDVGFVYFYSNKAIKSLGDLRSVKMWRWTEDELGKEMFKELGLSGVPLGVPAVLSALTTGRIDACYASPLAMVALQWYTKVRFSTSIPFSYSIGSTVVNLKKWNAVSDTDRKMIRKIQRVAAKKLRKTVRRDNRKAKKTIARSIQEVPVPDDLLRSLDTAARAVWKAKVGAMYSQDDLDLVLKYRAEYRARQNK